MTLIDTINGYKSYIGGVGAIAIGVGKFLYDWSTGNIQAYEVYLTWIIAGWTIIGGRSAIGKIH